jgi:putative transposase
MSRTTSPSTQKPYSLVRVCRVWCLTRSTVSWQRRPKGAPAGATARPGPIGPCADHDLVQHIKTILAATPFHGEGYRKVWARLRYAGLRTSKRRVLRLMRENQLLAPHRRGGYPGPRVHDGSITMSQVNDMWGTDMTAALTIAEGQAAIFFAVDHCSLECVGLHAAKRGTRFEALEPPKQGVRDYFGAFTPQAARGLTLRHDHGSQYMSHDFQEEIAFLGITSSPAFVRAPEGTGCAKRFVRILKENLLWVRTFRTVEELRQALLEFKRTYNENWIIQRHAHKTPAQVRREQSQAWPPDLTPNCVQKTVDRYTTSFFCICGYFNSIMGLMVFPCLGQHH